MSDLLAEIIKLRDAFNAATNNDTDGSSAPPCEPLVNHQLFHLYLLIPSAVTTLLMALMVKRTRLWLNIFQGRPGMVYPMDILGKSNRFSYAAAWGAVAYLASDVILTQKLAARIEGPSYVKVFVVLLSMLIYGMDYLPLFVSLAQNSLLGYTIGTLYAWMFFVVQIVKSSECDVDAGARVLVVFRDLPNILCLGYLSVSLPVRLILLIRQRSNLSYLLEAKERVDILGLKKDLRESVEGLHCLKLLRPLPPPPQAPEATMDKIKYTLRNIAERTLYKSQPGFRYSSRVLSVMLIGVIVLYKTTTELMVSILYLLNYAQKGLDYLLTMYGEAEEPDEEEYTFLLRQLIYFFYYTIVAFRGCFVTSVSLAGLIGLVMIIHMLASYRTNLFDLYRGDHTHIPPRSVQSNAGLLVGSMRYAGYQVGYIAWGFVVQVIIFLLITLVLAVTITLIRVGVYRWVIDFLVYFGPIILATILINVVQVLVAKFAFLQDRGNVLALNNRRALFTFSFFMFFYNIFLGIVSCLLRIIKAIVIGAVFMSRLDNSTLPRRFQLMDPGFSAYVGFIHVESAHTHPVVISFLKLLMLQVEVRKARKEEEAKMKTTNTEKLDEEAKRERERRSASARFKWYVLYTLYNNPQLRTTRKFYIDYVKMIQERMAQRYHLSHSAVAQLLKTASSAVNNLGLDVSARSSDEVHHLDGWRELMRINRFVANIQRDLARRQQASLGIDPNDLDMDHVDVGTEKTNGTNATGEVRTGGLKGWERLRVAVGTDKPQKNDEAETEL